MNVAPTSQTLLKTKLFSVEHRVYGRSADGDKVIERDVVVHPGAVVILPILDDGRIVLIRNFRYTVERELYELPAGTRSKDETPIATARRELEEETGYRAAEMKPLIEFYTSPGILTERMYAFLARGLTQVGQRLDPGEQISVEPVPPGEVRRCLCAGEFLDGKSIAALATYFLQTNA